MAEKMISIGRAKIVIVFGDKKDAIAVISSVVVRALDEVCKERMHFSGPVDFDESTTKHIKEMVLPIVDYILTYLDIPIKNYEVSIANISAVSTLEIGLNISGFSADVPVLLALLSASLQIPMLDDLVSTGHIASADGDITLVKNIPAKLRAAISDQSTQKFVYPSLEKDHSLETLLPIEKERIKKSIIDAKGKIELIAINDIAELLKAVLTDDEIVMSSLQKGYFGIAAHPSTSSSPTARAIEFLLNNNEKRFWTVLECYLLEGGSEKAKNLLHSRTQFHIQQQTYPKNLGYKLLQLVQSLPPTTRRIKTAFPLISMQEFIQLSQFALESDHEDVKNLYNAMFGKGSVPLPTGYREKGLTPTTIADSIAETLNTILSEIDKENLAKNIGLPIDTARATYLLDSVTIENHEEFNDIISAFYLHLLRHTQTIKPTKDLQKAGPDALALLERAFSTKGGIVTALVEAKDGTYGGMRFVLDVMTEHFKMEEQEKHINRILKEALDPLDWNTKVEFMKEFLKRLAPYLPSEIKTAPPERFARHYEAIIRNYIKSIDNVKDLLKSL